MNNIKNLMKIKFYWTRTGGYVALINSAMLLFLILSKLRDTGYVNISLKVLFIPSLLLGVIALILLGYIEVKLFKGYSEEVDYQFRLNPKFMELSNDVKEIKQMLNKSGTLSTNSNI